VILRMLARIAVIRVIRYHDIIVTEFNVSLDNNNPGLNALDGFPNPIIIAINVDREQVNLSLNPVPGNNLVDIFRLDVFTSK